jgi:hypothetical protein
MSAPSCAPTACPPVRPWHEVKSHRGALKGIPTEVYGCPKSMWKYHGPTDAHVHAVVGYGHHVRAEPIQDQFWQAGQHKFIVRRYTPLYNLKISPARAALILTAMAEGPSVAGAVHTFNHAGATITRWLRRAGGQAERIHRRFFRHLELLHVQLDELRTTLPE